MAEQQESKDDSDVEIIDLDAILTEALAKDAKKEREEAELAKVTPNYDIKNGVIFVNSNVYQSCSVQFNRHEKLIEFWINGRGGLEIGTNKRPSLTLPANCNGLNIDLEKGN